jgi:hypothetical protein
MFLLLNWILNLFIVETFLSLTFTFVLKVNIRELYITQYPVLPINAWIKGIMPLNFNLKTRLCIGVVS